MNYSKKIKTRMCAYCAYAAAGALAIVFGNHFQKEFLTPLGAAFIAVGAAGWLKLLRLFKKPEALKAAETAENDERNIYIYRRARALTFTAVSLIEAAGIIAAGILEKTVVMKTLSYVLMASLVIYLVCYYFIRSRE